MKVLLISTLVAIILLHILYNEAQVHAAAVIAHGSKKGLQCTLLPVKQEYEFDANNKTLSVKRKLHFEMIAEAHVECNYQTELLECIGNVCTCNQTTSTWSKLDQCLFRNGQACYTNSMCASGICSANCKCGDTNGIEILGVSSSNSIFKSLKFFPYGFTSILGLDALKLFTYTSFSFNY